MKRKINFSKTILLIAILFVSILLVFPKEVKAYSREQLASTFNMLRNWDGYRHGEYYMWNDGGYWSDYCTSGGHGGWQCHAYGIDLFDHLFQKCAMCSEYRYDMNNICVGDLIRFNNVPYGEHTVIVQDVVGDTVYYTDANGLGNGTVRWDQTASKSYFQSNLKYILHAPGNDVKSLTEYDEPVQPIDPPNNIKATNQGGTSIKITWDGVNGATKYEIVIYNASDVEKGDFSKRVKTVQTTSTNSTFTISNGEYYAYVHSARGDVWSSTGGNGAKFKIAPITSVSLSRTSITLNKNAATTLSAKINPSDTSDNKTLTWSSANSSIASVSSSGVVTGKKAGTTTITVRTSNGKTAKCTVTVKETERANIKYSTHIQEIGWQAYQTNGVTAGTTAKGYRLEGIKIKLDSTYSGSVQYRTHVQEEGWQGWVSNNGVSGTTGKSYRLEAIQIKLTGTIANYYDVYYRVHAQEFGWLGWAKNGASAGTEGFGYRLEAIQIKLVKKGGSAPGSTTNAFHQAPPTVMYTTHVQDLGWQTEVKNGATAGTVGKSLRLEGIKIRLTNQLVGGNIVYQTHVQEIGWQPEVKNGAIAGTTGQKLRLEAIRIRLIDELAKKYDIYYRVHAQEFGWLGWAKNGESAGTSGYSYRLEGIEIKILEKGSTPSTSTSVAYKSK